MEKNRMEKNRFVELLQTCANEAREDGTFCSYNGIPNMPCVDYPFYTTDNYTVWVSPDTDRNGNQLLGCFSVHAKGVDGKIEKFDF